MHKCDGCDKPLDIEKSYFISVIEYFARQPDGQPNEDAADSYDGRFCSWYCAASIVNEKYSEEREAEKAAGA